MVSHGNQCKKGAIPFLRYCWHHRERGLDYSLLITILALIFAVFVFLYQERHPDLFGRCYPNDDGDPNLIICEIENRGRGEAREVFLSFVEKMPIGTKIWSSPEISAELIDADYLPDPRLHPELAKVQRAFSVKLPRIAPKDKLTIHIATQDDDNLRASEQIKRIRNIIIEILTEFGGKVSETYPDLSSRWKLQDVISARIKEENFYTPDQISYEKGRYPVEFYTNEEKVAKAINQELYSRFKGEFIDVFQGRSGFFAPVIKIKTTEGEGGLALFPRYVKTCLKQASVTRTVTPKDYIYNFKPIPPDSYEGNCS